MGSFLFIKTRCSAGREGARVTRMLADLGDDLFDRHRGAVDADRVGSLAQRLVLAFAVGLVAFVQIALHGCEISVLSTRDEVGVMTHGPDVRIGVEEDLDLRVRKDARPDVAAFHHDAAVHTEAALLHEQDAAHGGMLRDDRYGARDLGGADLLRVVGAVDVQLVGTERSVVDELQGQVLGHARDALAVFEREIVDASGEGDGAIERAGVDVGELESRGYELGDRALAGPGGAVDGDDGALSVHWNLLC